jgi:hypothetical protein
MPESHAQFVERLRPIAEAQVRAREKQLLLQFCQNSRWHTGVVIESRRKNSRIKTVVYIAQNTI